MATKKNQNNNQSVNNQSANNLKYATYTSQKSGKTIPVVVGFSGKDDERIAYIAQIGKDGEPSAVHGRYTQLMFNGQLTPCVMWGAADCWHAVAKLAAKTVNNLDALTQEAYDALCTKADEAYQSRKAENEQKKKETPKEQVQPGPVKPAPQSKKQTKETKQETKVKASKPASKSKEEAQSKMYSHASLMAAFEQVAKSLHLDKDNKETMKQFVKSILAKAS